MDTTDAPTQHLTVDEICRVLATTKELLSEMEDRAGQLVRRVDVVRMASHRRSCDRLRSQLEALGAQVCALCYHLVHEDAECSHECCRCGGESNDN